MHFLYGWWCPGCQAWKTRDDIRPAEQDEVCLDVCTECGSVVEDRRFLAPDDPAA
jgi:Zn ribbon nucleic-acid-binding protein